LAAATLAFWLDERDDTHRHIEQSEALGMQLGQKSKVHLAETKNLQLIIYTVWKLEHEPMEVQKEHEENLKVFQEAGDSWMSAHTIFFIGAALQRSGDLTGARQALEQSLTLFREYGDHIRAAQQNIGLASIALEEGKYAEARTRLEEVLSFYRQAQVIFAADVPSVMLGAVAIREQDYARAKALYTECLLLDKQMGEYQQLAECLIGFAGIAIAEKRFERAAQLLGAAETEVQARRSPLENFDQAELKRLMTVLREKLGDADFDELANEGRAMTMEQAIAFALEQSDS
jgi:tetratricopeptide (TPR) repeat protein